MRVLSCSCAFCLSGANIPCTAGALPSVGRHNYRSGVTPSGVMVPFPKGEAQDANPRSFHRHLDRQPVARVAGECLGHPAGRIAYLLTRATGCAATSGGIVWCPGAPRCLCCTLAPERACRAACAFTGCAQGHAENTRHRTLSRLPPGSTARCSRAHPAAQLAGRCTAQFQPRRNPFAWAIRSIEAAGCPGQRLAHDGQGLCRALPHAGHWWAVPGLPESAVDRAGGGGAACGDAA
ncbi:hypothetical protein D3C80_1350460 [compost metagenome]